MRKRGNIALFLALLAGITMARGSALSSYIEGNRAYREDRFAGAVMAYEQAVSVGANDSRVYYNLGNAYFRTGQMGRAILSYERARLLAPRDDDILTNLEFVRVTQVDIVRRTGGDAALGDVYENTFLGLIYSFLEKIAAGEFIAVLGILSILGALGLIFWILVSGRIRRIFFWSAAAFWLLFVIVLIPYIVKRSNIRETRKAIVVEGGAEIRSAPSDKSQLEFTYQEGMEVAVREVRGDYSRVTLRSGGEGWVLNDHIESVATGNAGH